MVVAGIIVSVGGFTTTPLAYRWKGMEKAACKGYRGMRQHSLLLRVFRRLYPAADVDKAATELANLTSTDNDTSLKLKLRIRGGTVAAHLEKNPRGKDLEVIIILNVGLQGYLNLCFKPEEKVSEYTDLLQCVGEAYEEQSAELIKLRSECSTLNFRISAGAGGIEVLERFTRFVDTEWNSGDWSEWNLDYDEKSRVCLDMIAVWG